MKTLSSYKQFAKNLMFEADESDKYTHIGYGKYKEKGKEDDKDAQTFKKDDSGKFSPVGGEKGGEEVPDSQKISGAEFERPGNGKDTKQDVDSDMYAQDTWKQSGPEEPSGEEVDKIELPYYGMDSSEAKEKSEEITDKSWDQVKRMEGKISDEKYENMYNDLYDLGSLIEDKLEYPTRDYDEKYQSILKTMEPESKKLFAKPIKQYLSISVKKEESIHSFAEMFKRIRGK